MSDRKLLLPENKNNASCKGHAKIPVDAVRAYRNVGSGASSA